MESHSNPSLSKQMRNYSNPSPSSEQVGNHSDPSPEGRRKKDEGVLKTFKTTQKPPHPGPLLKGEGQKYKNSLIGREDFYIQSDERDHKAYHCPANCTRSDDWCIDPCDYGRWKAEHEAHQKTCQDRVDAQFQVRDDKSDCKAVNES